MTQRKNLGVIRGFLPNWGWPSAQAAESVPLQTHSRPEHIEGPNEGHVPSPAGTTPNPTLMLYHSGIAVNVCHPRPGWSMIEPAAEAAHLRLRRRGDDQPDDAGRELFTQPDRR